MPLSLGAATLFAVALLASGQSSSIIATVAGQAVSEGFLQWRTSPAIRRIFTRLLAIIPSMAVAITVGRPGIDSLLVISQVILSIVLPFIMVPLIYCTSSKSIMSVRKPREREREHDHGDLPSEPLDTALRISSTTTTTTTTPNTPPGGEEAGIEMEIVDFSSGWFATGIGVAICLLVASANVFVLVSLGRGTQG
ncbi:hypothetical protein H0H93_014833 [Arthromyces matolae]|nr:hypothetical protein H0H93_014833 [Arthromyces matolae]